jgi:hypothetical protein
MRASELKELLAKVPDDADVYFFTLSYDTELITEFQYNSERNEVELS